MIDPSIITRGAEMAQLQQRQNMDALADLGGNLGQLVLGRRINQMRQLKTPEEQQAFANNSIFSPMLNTQLTADRSAAAKAANDQLKFDADLAETYGKIGKLGAESGKIGAETGKISTETGITRQNNAASIWNVYLKGGAGAAKAVLEGMKARGLIDETNYQAELTALTDLDGKTAAEQQQYALGRYKGVQDPKYSLTTADNVLDNQTSDKNAQLSATVQREKIEQDGQIAQEKLSLDQAKLEFDQKKGTVMQWGDTMYMVYPDNSVKEIRSPTGQKIAPGKPESKIEKIERVEKTQNFAIASRSAADGATLAASLANDLDGMNAAAGGFGLQARVPGSQAHSFASKLETLKSGVFLAQIGNMKGMGALTDAEGARLEKSIAALDLSLSPQDLQVNLTQIAQTLSRAAKAASSKAHLYAGQDQPARPKQDVPATLANPFGGEKPNAMDFFK